MTKCPLTFSKRPQKLFETGPGFWSILFSQGTMYAAKNCWRLGWFFFPRTTATQTLLANYRPIALCNSFYQLMNIIITSRIRRLTEKYAALESSLSGKNLANNGHSSYKCGSLAELPEASAAGNFFLEGASASENDFAWILSRFLIILYLPKMTLLKDTCLTYEELLSQPVERLGEPQKFQQNSDFIH